MARRADVAQLYYQMCRIRYAEQATARLWQDGLVYGELHSGAGEEAVAAGFVAHLRPGDAMSVDYRSTPPFVARGTDLVRFFLELLGDEDGLCAGRAGHMHLMLPAARMLTSGIVGAPGPAACGFGLAAVRRRDRTVALAFFGDGAVNEGMLMESLNLAAVWRLPVVFVCKDNGVAVTTRSRRVTGGGPARRARGLGLSVVRVDGGDVSAVWRAARRAIGRARRGRGPTFVIARTARMAGHVAGDPLASLGSAVRLLSQEVGELTGSMFARPGGSAPQRARALLDVGATMAAALLGTRSSRDPLARARRRLRPAVASAAEERARAEVDAAVATALVRNRAHRTAVAVDA